jgi:hypothetical protein
VNDDPFDVTTPAESRRMMALDSAVRCKGEFETADELLVTATKFLAFLEGSLISVTRFEPGGKSP